MLLKGVCNILERWKLFLIELDNVEKAFQYAKQEGIGNKIKRMTDKKNSNKLLYIRPMQRVLLSLFVSLISFLCIYRMGLEPLLMISILWVAFALTFIITSAIVFFNVIPRPGNVNKI